MVHPFAAHAVARLLSASAIQCLSTSRPPHLAMSWLARSEPSRRPSLLCRLRRTVLQPWTPTTSLS
jgi:hypothetical protein